jgi:hypothetical protein
MLPGFNHNIKHNGRIYHVQTEDSGVSNPHIITHLFVGGNILATKKTSYADIVNADNLTVVVRELMEEQHKAMLRNLVNGVYDGLDLPGKPVEPAAPPPAPPVAAPTPAPGKFPAPAKVPDIAGPAPAPASRTQPAIPAHEAPTQPVMPAVGGAQIYKPPPPEPIPAKPLPAKPLPVKPAQPAKPAPPVKPAPRVTVRPSKPVQPPPAAEAPKPSPDLPPEVLAARRLADRPKPKDTTGPTIFGEDLISEKSLDEVILGYLAGDGEEGS